MKKKTSVTKQNPGGQKPKPLGEKKTFRKRLAKALNQRRGLGTNSST